MKIIKASLRLYLIHCSAILAIGLAMYFPGLDLLLAFLYLGILWKEARYNNANLSPLGQTIVGFLWQLPGIVLIFTICLAWNLSDGFSYYAIFILELWQTPILPIISLIPVYYWAGRPLYYYLLLIMVPILIGYYLTALIKPKPWLAHAEKI